MNLSTSEQLMYTTVRIECNYKDRTSGTGTGFFFDFLINKSTNTHVPVIITNKHVVNNAVNGEFVLTLATNNQPSDTTHFKVTLDNFESWWRKHPDDNVDLCAMPIAPILEEARKQGKQLFYIPINKSLVPSSRQLEDFSALEEILMIGYPNGVWDDVNNKPIFRRGITATHPKFDYRGKKEIIIDAACFPGSSGSPVFVFSEGGYTDKRGNMCLGQSRVIFLGVLYAGPQHIAHGEIRIINTFVNQAAISFSHIPNNLGFVIKAEKVLELELLFKT